MKQSGSGMIEAAKAALLSCLSNVPFLRVIDVQEELDGSDVRVDLVVDIELPDRISQLVGEIKRSGQPRLAREAVNQILRYKSKIPGAYFVFIAPYISQRAADICRAEDVGYLDLSGNCFLWFDRIFIEKKNYPNQFKEKRDLKSLYATKAERILRALLCNPGRNWNIKALADDSGVSLGQASNVKRTLEDREMLSGKRGAFSLGEPASILQEWTENYDYRKNSFREFYCVMNVTEIEAAIATYCAEHNVLYALTGFSGAARIGPAVRYNRAMIYAVDFPEQALSALSFKAVNSGGNLLLFTPYDSGVFYGSTEIDGARVVSNVQLYLDLAGFRDRGEEAAEMLMKRVLENAL